MAESIVPLRKKIKDSLTRQGIWNIRGLRGKGLAEREEKERVLSSERAHKQVLTVENNMHLILDLHPHNKLERNKKLQCDFVSHR